ncbi:MAG: undecaprenyl-phosphate galactose phosphotransferase WbaP [Thermoanaerobacterales bacterium]|nr:undecaprenyl-phosphate galactose phosphotransferase WbaP [Thermoanaerobacterales bacterium]
MNLPPVAQPAAIDPRAVDDMPLPCAAFAPLAAVRRYARRLAEGTALAGLDLLALGAAAGLAVAVRVAVLPRWFDAFPPRLPAEIFTQTWWIGLVFVAAFAWQGLYTRRLPFWREFENTVKACTLGFLVVMAVVSLGKMSGQVSRTLLTLVWLFALAAVPAARYAGKNLLARAGLWRRRVLILGAGRTGEMVADAVAREPFLGYQVVGFLDDDPAKRRRTFSGPFGRPARVLGGFADAERVMAGTGVRTLVVAAPGLPGPKLVSLVNRLQQSAEKVLVVPDLFGIPVVGVEADYFFNEQALVLRVRNNLANPLNAALKRVLDILAGGAALALCLPLFAVIGLAIKLDSPGPVFYRCKRLGRRGREFDCWKFRTMYLNNDTILRDYLAADPAAREEWERYAKLRGRDPRVTRAGRFLRRFSLDELPQLINVLMGDMSLAGPRPYLPRERERLGDHAATILLARPGLTGLWQVSGRNDVDFDGRLYLESWYVRNWSLWLDLTLLLRTVTVVLGRKGAY